MIPASPSEQPLPTIPHPPVRIRPEGLASWDWSPTWSHKFASYWHPGAQGATERLRAWADPGIDTYDATRNRPATSGTSRLSPHLAFGELSIRDLWHQSLQAQDLSFARQLGWREFAHHTLAHNPDLATEPLRPEFRTFPWIMDRARFDAWKHGQTGYPLVDAGMRQLWETGWMHNRVRMVVASFLTKHLMIPWQAGAAWFMETLLDADEASNSLNWQWAAGCGVDAAPYFRIFNPTLQAEKFDPEGTYQDLYVPERHSPTYPKPIVEHGAARTRALAAFAAWKA